MPDASSLTRLLPPRTSASESAWSPLCAGGAVSRSVLEAMRLEGLVVHVAGAVYLPADAVPFTASRLAALRLMVPAGGVVALLAAAWGHGVEVPPDPVDVLVRRAAAAGRGVEGLREREARVDCGDVVERCGVRLTSPARTAADVARLLPPDVARPVVATLLAAGAEPAAVLAALRRDRRYPGAVGARALVGALGQEVAAPARRPVSR